MPTHTRLVCFAFLAAAAVGQQVPPNIVAEGVPSVPAELVRRLAPFENIRTAAFSSWHPRKREMLISTRFADTGQIHAVRAPGGYRQQLTFFREPAGSARYSPQTGNYFLFSMDEGGSEFYQIYRFDLDKGDWSRLTEGKAVNDRGPFSNKSGQVAFTSTRRNGRDFDIYVMNPLDPASQKLVFQANGAWGPLEWSPDDKQLLAIQYISINESYLHVVDLTSGKAEPLLPAGSAKVAYASAVWDKNGKGVYLTSDRESEFQRIWYFDLTAKSLTCLTSHIPWDVDQIDLSPDGSVLAFVVNEDGVDKLHLLDTAARRELPQPALPMGLIGNITFHPVLPEIGFTFGSTRSPADAYSYEWKTRTVHRWTFSETGGLNAASFPDTALVHYPTFDTVNGKPRMLPAFLTKPPSRFQAPYPVLIEIHGGPEGQSRPVLNASYYLNQMGIAIIRPNVRGSAGYGKTYLQLDNGFKREDSVKDIGALLDWIAAQPDLDAKRVAVTGGSYGGYMALASMVHYSSRLKCGVDVVGVSNWVTFLNNTQEYRRDLRRPEYGDERDPKMREFLERISPLNHVDQIKVPMLVVQGKNDPRVPVSESEQMVKRVRESGGTVWYVLGNDEGHGFRKKQNRDYQRWAEIVFLEQYLLK